MLKTVKKYLKMIPSKWSLLISKLSISYVKIHITLTGFLQSLLMSLLLLKTNKHSAVKILKNLSHVLLIGLPCLVLLTVILF